MTMRALGVAVFVALAALPLACALAGDDAKSQGVEPAAPAAGTATTTVIINGTVGSVKESSPSQVGVVIDPTLQDSAEQARARAQNNLANGTVEQPDPQTMGTVQTTIAAQGVYSIKKSDQPNVNSCIQIGTVEKPTPDCGTPAQ